MVPNGEFWLGVCLFLGFGLIGIDYFRREDKGIKRLITRGEEKITYVSLLVLVALLGMAIIKTTPPTEFGYLVAAATGNLLSGVGVWFIRLWTK